MTNDEKRDFFKQYMNPLVTEDELRRAFVLKERLLPKSLYRFRPPNAFTLEEITKLQVYLGPASRQTDNLDTTLKLDVADISHVQAVQNIDQYLAHLRPPPTQEERALIEAAPNVMTGIRKVLETRHPEWAAQRNAKANWMGFLNENNRKLETIFSEAVQAGMVICCFCEDASPHEMWEEFAAEGTGVCFEYPFEALEADDQRRKYMFPVIYSDEPFDATNDFIAKIQEPNRRNRIAWGATMTKSASLRKEREWRFVLFEGRVTKGRYIQMPIPRRVILGEKISPDYESQVRAAAQSHSIPVETPSKK